MNHKRVRLAAGLLLAAGLAAAAGAREQPMEKDMGTNSDTAAAARAEGLELATLGGGCFWCVEAVYERIEGVKSVVSGYAGGSAANPTYEQVCTGTTGHAEVVQIAFDPKVIGFEKILEIFWKAHDPTTLNRQGADVGTQYRSIVFYNDEAQKAAAEKSIRAAGKLYDRPIVTQLEPLQAFYPAEEYHQDYYRNNPYTGYCGFVIRPKLQKLGLEQN